MSPHTTPKTRYHGILFTINGSAVSRGNIGSVPVSIYEIAVAVTEEMSKGATEVIVRSIISTSSVNTRPAIGALKIPPIAPAAPHPIMSIMVFWSKRNAFARLEPMAAPVRTIGASAPTEPPKPMVRPDPMMEDHMLCALMIDLRCEIAYRILVIPCEISSRTIYLTKRAASVIPMIGVMRYHHVFPSPMSCSSTIHWIKWINDFSMAAAAAEKAPTKKERSNTKCFSLM